VARQGNIIDANLIIIPRMNNYIISELRELYNNEEIINPSSPFRRRETEAISYISQGYSNKEIAASLGISQQTVKTYVTSTMTKLDAKDRTEAAVKAIKNNWGVHL
jgi:DNA-binding NarL/FixJ family response regulator